MAKNTSGRQMTKYAASKSDPICKWRAVSVSNVIELVSWLPKQEMTKEKFREYMAKNLEGDFFHTSYQLACQLGLYYEDDVKYIPRFNHDITDEEAEEYLKKWVMRYYVPNPYTKRGFKNVSPMHFLIALMEYIENYPTKPNLETAGAALFGGEMGNVSSVKSFLNSFASVLKIDKDNNIIVSGTIEGTVKVDVDRDDKSAFFDHFR